MTNWKKKEYTRGEGGRIVSQEKKTRLLFFLGKRKAKKFSK